MSDDRRGFATRAVHAPPARLDQQPSSVPIHLASTFRFETSEDYAETIAFRRPGSTYSRGYGNPTVESFEAAIADLEGRASQARARLASLERERFTDPAAGSEIGTVVESLKSFDEQLAVAPQYVAFKLPRPTHVRLLHLIGPVIDNATSASCVRRSTPNAMLRATGSLTAVY